MGEGAPGKGAEALSGQGSVPWQWAPLLYSRSSGVLGPELCSPGSRHHHVVTRYETLAPALPRAGPQLSCFPWGSRPE